MCPVWPFGHSGSGEEEKSQYFYVKEQTFSLLATTRFICQVSGGSHNPVLFYGSCADPGIHNSNLILLFIVESCQSVRNMFKV